jgi:hypothetical protein
MCLELQHLILAANPHTFPSGSGSAIQGPEEHMHKHNRRTARKKPEEQRLGRSMQYTDRAQKIHTLLLHK